MNKFTVNEITLASLLNRPIIGFPECSDEEKKVAELDCEALMMLISGETAVPIIRRHSSSNDTWTILSDDWAEFISESNEDKAVKRLLIVLQMLIVNDISDGYEINTFCEGSFTFTVDEIFHSQLLDATYLGQFKSWMW